MRIYKKVIFVLSIMNGKDLKKVISLLQSRYGENLYTQLAHKNMTELFAAVLLSPQCSDPQVNKTTKTLFNKYKTFSDYANADINALQRDIRGLNYYKTKAKYLKMAAEKIMEEYNGRIPRNLEGLMSLQGVGRKVGNVILNEGFGINEGIAIDTHCTRVSGRLHIPGGKRRNPKKIEQWLMKNADKKDWGEISNLFIALGRDACKPRKECYRCVLKNVCPSSDVQRARVVRK